MGANRPKQYLMLGAQTMLEHAVDAMLADARIDRVMVVLAPDDEYGAQLPGLRRTDRLDVVRIGGSSRAASVRAGLRALQAAPDDWVLVHDAARCLIEPDVLLNLIRACEADAVGGLLAHPVPDTLKRADAQGRVLSTVSRESLWAAQTPQMFRLGLLRESLQRALQAGVVVTDEASAVEWAGHAPRLVMGPAENFKVTYPPDFQRAAELLQRRLQGKPHGLQT